VYISKRSPISGSLLIVAPTSVTNFTILLAWTYVTNANTNSRNKYFFSFLSTQFFHLYVAINNSQVTVVCIRECASPENEYIRSFSNMSAEKTCHWNFNCYVVVCIRVGFYAKRFILLSWHRLDFDVCDLFYFVKNRPYICEENDIRQNHYI